MTERVQRFFAVQADQDSELGPRQVRLRASTEALGRDGLVVVTRGIDLEPYRTNPVMLWQHKREDAVAQAIDISTANGELVVLAEFAAEGTSARADEICGLVKQGIVRGISAGFDVYETEPVDPKNRSAGRRVTKSELLEISFVTVPAERNSLVTERSDDEAANDNEPATEQAERTSESIRIENPEDPSQFVTVQRPKTIVFKSDAELERAGKTISAATRAKMREVAGHLDTMAACHAEAMRCIREMMDEEDRDMDEGGEEMRAAPEPANDNAPITPAERFRRQLALRTRAA